MAEESRKNIRDIIEKMDCPNDFRCTNSDLENVCKAKDIGLDNHLVCLDDDPYLCQSSMPYGDIHFCTCPVRIHLAKKIKD